MDLCKGLLLELVLGMLFKMFKVVVSGSAETKDEPVLPYQVSDDEDLHDQSQHFYHISVLDLLIDKDAVLVDVDSSLSIFQALLLSYLYVHFYRLKDHVVAHIIIQLLDPKNLNEPHKRQVWIHVTHVAPRNESNQIKLEATRVKVPKGYFLPWLCL